MAAFVQVITGPAGSGKTEQILHRYRTALVEYGPGGALWLAPNHRSAQEIRRRLLNAAQQACLGPGVMTFDRFADAILTASTATTRHLGGLLKRQLLRRLIRQAIDGGRLQHFAPVATTRGLVDLLSEWIRELKRLEIWPADFEAACRQRGLRAKDRELAALYTAYQDRLTQHQLYDAEGRFWSARALLREGQLRPFEHVKFVVADGFTDFTRTQHEILEILAQRVDELTITLPLDDASGRDDLFAKPQQTLDRLRKIHEHLQVQRCPRRGAEWWPALAHIERELFQDPRRSRPAPDTNGIEIIAASGRIGELEMIGRRIKSLLVEGDPARGTGPVPPGDIAVVFRSAADSAPLVREVFGELGLPFSIEAPPSLSDAGAVRALLAVIRLAVDDWPFEQVLALLANSYFRPQWPEWEQGRASVDAQWAVRRLQIASGRRALLEAIERRLRRLDEEEDSREKARWSRSLAVLRRLSDALEQLPREATPAAWGTALTQLLDELGFSSAFEDESAVSGVLDDRTAWQTLRRSLAAGDQLANQLGEAAPKLDRRDFQEWLLDVVQWEQPHTSLDETGRVRVLSAQSVRALRVPYLFLAGLSERSFPSPGREDRMYAESEYQRLRDAGLPLVLRAERNQEEMLLFYEVLTRATRRLYLSYPALDDKAEPLLPSPFLGEVQRACGATPIAVERADDLSPVPRGSEPCSPRELRIKGMAEALEGRPALLAGLFGQSGANVASNIAAGLLLTRHRARGESFGPFEGILTGPDALARLSANLADRTWSPTQLEQYAACPYQFFLSQVLGIRPLETLEFETDYGRRGGLLHDALAELHKRLNELHEGECSPGAHDEETLLAHFIDVLDQLRPPLEGETLAAALHEIDRRQLLQWLRHYRQQHAEYDRQGPQGVAPRAAHFEVSFGLARTSDDPLSTPTPLRLSSGGREVRIAGRIDRIDLVELGGRLLFNIIDYKSGSVSAPKTIDGTSLQLELYAMVAEDLLFAEKKALGWQAGYWQIRSNGFYKPLQLAEADQEQCRVSPDWEGRRQLVTAKVHELIDGIFAGAFPMQSLDDDCTSRCDFKTVCRVNQVRSLGKVWPPPEQPQD